MHSGECRHALYRCFFPATEGHLTHKQTLFVSMESVDAVGIVFYAAYWTWFEQVFEGFVAAASGSTWRDFLQSGMAMPVVHAEIDYMRPLHLSDRVTVELRLVDTGRRSIRFEAIYRDEGGEPAAIARTVHVITDRGLSTASIPDWVLRAVEPTTPEGPK